jgi:hypothetical protein
MMKQILVGLFAATTMLLAACTYQKETIDYDITGIKHPDGRIEVDIKKRSTNETIKIEGDSIRQIKRLAPLQNADAAEMDVQVVYRYEYAFDVYDATGNFVETVAVATLEDFIELIPLAFDLGGFNAPPSSELDDLAADAAANWVSPYTHWMLHN